MATLTLLTGGDLDVAAQSVSLTDSALDAVAIVSRAGVIAQTLDLAALTVTAAGAVELGSVAASGAIAVETGGALSAEPQDSRRKMQPSAAQETRLRSAHSRERQDSPLREGEFRLDVAQAKKEGFFI